MNREDQKKPNVSAEIQNSTSKSKTMYQKSMENIVTQDLLAFLLKSSRKIGNLGEIFPPKFLLKFSPEDVLRQGRFQRNHTVWI
ncbi:hypothetical protein C5167_028538 [Papaver somniferum]|nr:hypothetical protein C5167_028538 [Papaver somniferum]